MGYGGFFTFSSHPLCSATRACSPAAPHWGRRSNPFEVHCQRARHLLEDRRASRSGAEVRHKLLVSSLLLPLLHLLPLMYLPISKTSSVYIILICLPVVLLSITICAVTNQMS